MYKFYYALTSRSALFLDYLIKRRLIKGKEDPSRVNEKRGIPSKARPEGALVWVHAASVGEAQSTLILMNRLVETHPYLNILITTGTVSSAKLIENKLPARAFHQYYPLDHPVWTSNFLSHWRPDFVLWMESELWPNMLCQIKALKIPALLLNARLSKKSFSRWKKFPSFIQQPISAFHKILCQTPNDAHYFNELGSMNTMVTGNLKFSASPLGFDKADFQNMNAFMTGRPVWLFASTHKGEEEMACRVHQILKPQIADLLTIIVPRHPERSSTIMQDCKNFGLNMLCRGATKIIPKPETDIYIADTLGELGLFYRISPITCMGRSFSLDGGGGHNPIEPAQLGCVVLHGPKVQNLQEIYDMMDSAECCLPLDSENHLLNSLLDLLKNQDKRQTLQKKALNFTRSQIAVADIVLQEISELIQNHTQISLVKSSEYSVRGHAN